jgi:hypothetical protein
MQRHHTAHRRYLRQAHSQVRRARNLSTAAAVNSPSRYTLIPGNTTASSSTATMTLSTCQPIWLTSGYDLRVSCYDLLAKQPSPSLAFLARSQHHFDDVSSLFNLYFGCDHLTEQSSLSLDSFYVHSPSALESSLNGGLSHGVFLSTENQQKWLLESTSSLLQLRSHHFIDDNTLSVTVFFITRSLGEEQLFYAMNQVTISLATEGEVSSDIQTIFVPMVGYQYGYGGYPWLFHDVFVLEVILGVLLALFTLRESYQLLVWRLIPLCRYLSSWLPSLAPSSHSYAPPPTSVPVGSQPNPNHHRRQSIAETLASQLQQVDTFLNDEEGEGEGEGEEEEEYHTDGKLYHDLLDWVTVFVLLLRGSYRVRYLREAISFHSFLTDLEEEHDFSSHTKRIATFFLTLQGIDQSLHLLSILLVFVVTLQFFRYLSYDPRCRIIVTTVQTSLSGLVPVLIIFLVILIAYAVLASGIYGIVIPQYATYDTTLAALFVMLLGNWEYDSCESSFPSASHPSSPHPSSLRSDDSELRGDADLLLVLRGVDLLHPAQHGHRHHLHHLRPDR